MGKTNKRRKAALKRIGRRKKTGGFAKISKKAGKKYKSKAAGNRVAGAIYWKMARKHKRKGKGKGKRRGKK